MRSGTGVAERLGEYLHNAGHALPQLPDRGGFDTNLVIDLVSFNAHALRVYCQGSLR